MLGLLSCLHCLQIQLQLEAQHEQTEIEYPRNSMHKIKEGHRGSVEMMNINLKGITDEDIDAKVHLTKLEAKEAANDLGMFLEEKDEVPENINHNNEHNEDEDSETDDPIYKENHNEPDEHTDEHEASNEMQMLSDTDNLAKDVLELEKA